MRQSAEVVVVGGGAAGVCAAHELAQRGHEVLLLERAELCAGSSYGNAAFLSPSRSLPLGAPGVIRKSLRWMIEPHGVFRLRPRLEPELARWLLAFRRACAPEAALHSAVVVRDLTRESLALYESYAAHLDFGFRRDGLLELVRTPEGMAAIEVEARRLAEIGVETSLLDAAGARALVPNLEPSVSGGMFCREDAHADPPAFVREVAADAQRLGATVQTQTEVLRLVRRGGEITSLETTQGEVTAGTVVLANGAWAARAGRALGLRLLIEPAKGYSFRITGVDGGRPAMPLLLAERRTTVTPIGDGVRVTSKLDLVGFDASHRGSRVDAIPGAVASYLELPATHRVTESWSGFRPLTPDGLPIVGRPQGLSNLILAVGGGRMGLALAPAMGRMVAAVAGGDDGHPHLRNLSPDRFALRRER